jgi:hypothetical protein
MLCPGCRNELTSSARYCYRCGTAVEQTAEEAETPEIHESPTGRTVWDVIFYIGIAVSLCGAAMLLAARGCRNG